MVIFSIRDLRPRFSPRALNDKDDILGLQDSNPTVILANGTIIGLPPEIDDPTDMNNEGLVLSDSTSSFPPALFDIKTSTLEQLGIPGFGYVNIRVSAIND